MPMLAAYAHGGLALVAILDGAAAAAIQTWMDEDGIPEVLKTERMGHEMPGMHGVYGHVSPAMHATLR
jgi:hypothetical protein